MYVYIATGGDGGVNTHTVLDVTGDDYDPLIYNHFRGYITEVVYQRYGKHGSISEIHTVSLQQTGKW